MLIKAYDRRQTVTLLVLFVAFFLWLTANPAFAARSLSISSNSTLISGDETIAINSTLSEFSDGETIYVKAAFYKNGSSNYFGLTQKGNEWVKNSDNNINQKSVVIGSWDNVLIAKSDFADSGFQGNGEYLLKVRFYTVSGSSLSSYWSTNSLAINLIQPTPTPTPPTPTVAPVLTSTSSPTQTPTSTPTPKPTNTPSPQPTVKPTIILADSNPENSSPANEDLPEIDLSINNAIEFTPTIEPEVLGTDSARKSKPTLPTILIIAGTLLTLAGGVLLAYQEIKKGVA